MGAGADVFIAVDGSGSDDPDGRGIFFHDAELGVGSVGAEEHFSIDVEGVLHLAGRMVGREIESFVVVPIRIHIWAVLDGKAHAREDRDDFIEERGQGMLSSHEPAAAWEGDIDIFI